MRTKSLATANHLGFLLAKAAQHFNELLHERFALRGFPEVRASYGSVLVPLFEHDGLRAGEIAARARLSKQSVTGLIKLCEQDGLVARDRDPGDGRAFRITLTVRGKKFQAVAEEVLAELDAEVIAALGAKERDALIEALKGVMDL